MCEPALARWVKSPSAPHTPHVDMIFEGEGRRRPQWTIRKKIAICDGGGESAELVQTVLILGDFSRWLYPPPSPQIDSFRQNRPFSVVSWAGIRPKPLPLDGRPYHSPELNPSLRISYAAGMPWPPSSSSARRRRPPPRQQEHSLLPPAPPVTRLCTTCAFCHHCQPCTRAPTVTGSTPGTADARRSECFRLLCSFLSPACDSQTSDFRPVCSWHSVQAALLKEKVAYHCGTHSASS